MNDDVVRARAVVQGRVQMVGFRDYVLRHAGALGLHGTVRNEPDGSLECVVEGPQQQVETLVEMLAKGPSHARVDRVDVEYTAPAGNLPRMSVTA